MGKATLYVGNLDSSVTNKELYKHFKAQAPDCSVSYCAIVTDDSQHSLGYGFVEYFRYDQAAKAMKLLDSTMLISKPIQVFFSPFHNDSSPSLIFIKNLDKSFDKLALLHLVGSYGDILSINLASDEFQGYAAVRYDWVESAQAAISGLNGSLFGNNKRLHVSSFLLAKHYGYPELAHNTLFLKLLSSDVSELYLRDALCVFGVITGVRVVEKLPNGQLFGIVAFENSKVADKAAHALKNRFHPLFGYLGKLHQNTSTFRALGEMDAKVIISKQLHLNLFEEAEGEKTKRSQPQFGVMDAKAIISKQLHLNLFEEAEGEKTKRPQAHAQFSQMFPIALTSPGGPLLMYPPPLPIYPPLGSGFGQQTLYPQALPTLFPLQPGFWYQQQLIPPKQQPIPPRRPYTYWGSNAKDLPDAQGKPVDQLA